MHRPRACAYRASAGSNRTAIRWAWSSGAAYVDEVVTSSAVGTWKPAPAVYHFSAHTLGVELDRMALVAVHAWDCHGAKRVGAMAGWCSRLEGEPGDVFEPADVRGDDLVEVVEGLLAL